MTNFSNLKIQIKDQQPLDEMVRELERLGYKQAKEKPDHFNMIYAGSSGYYTYMNVYERKTTLAELKEM